MSISQTHFETTISREQRRRASVASAGRVDALLRGNCGAMRSGFVAFAMVLDTVAILTVAVLATDIYHWTFYHSDAPVEVIAHLAALIAALYVAPNLFRGAYAFHRYLSREGHILPLFERWTLAFLGAMAFSFATRTSADLSRGAAILFFCGGGLALIAAQAAMAIVARKISQSSAVFLRRIFLVGHEADIAAFNDRYPPEALGMKVVNACVLRGAATIREDLNLATAAARLALPDDVFILAPWHDTATIDACVEAFMRVPASIHMGPERVLDRFSDAHISKIGPISSLRLVRRPLNPLEVGLKRLFDLVAAALALVLLSPLFLIVAIAIKLDSKGPVFFLQRRYGFNQEPFRIVKFRSLTEMEDHAGLRQVTRSDSRITRVGRFIRRSNIDELPQLINVLTGHMSLVGPRPHAMAHDHLFERSIALSARRHNVKPGITGWAQAHGFRGEIDTEEKLRGRIEHDLYYIDNWSIWLDLQILALTVFSRKAYRNAY